MSCCCSCSCCSVPSPVFPTHLVYYSFLAPISFMHLSIAIYSGHLVGRAANKPANQPVCNQARQLKGWSSQLGRARVVLLNLCRFMLQDLNFLPSSCTYVQTRSRSAGSYLAIAVCYVPIFYSIASQLYLISFYVAFAQPVQTGAVVVVVVVVVVDYCRRWTNILLHIRKPLAYFLALARTRPKCA